MTNRAQDDGKIQKGDVVVWRPRDRSHCFVTVLEAPKSDGGEGHVCRVRDDQGQEFEARVADLRPV